MKLIRCGYFDGARAVLKPKPELLKTLTIIAEFDPVPYAARVTLRRISHLRVEIKSVKSIVLDATERRILVVFENGTLQDEADEAIEIFSKYK